MSEHDKSFRSGMYVGIVAMLGYLLERLERIDPDFSRDQARADILERLRLYPEGDVSKQVAAEAIISAAFAQRPKA